MLHKILDKIKGKIGIVKFDDAKILIDTDDKLGDDISFKKCSAISDMFYQRWCLEDNLLNQHNAKHLKKPEEELMYAVWHPARY